jgi:preprotein translocase subunit SecB
MAENEAGATQQGGEQKTIQPQKVYVKDISFESPNSPRIFTKKWEPESKIEFQNAVQQIDSSLYEVVVTLTVTTSIGGETAYLAEVHQAGIFLMQGFDAPELHMQHNIFCMRFLYPYASAAISDLVTRGSFPQLLLNPLNFEKIYMDRVNKLRESTAGESQQPDTQRA